MYCIIVHTIIEHNTMDRITMYYHRVLWRQQLPGSNSCTHTQLLIIALFGIEIFWHATKCLCDMPWQ